PRGRLLLLLLAAVTVCGAVGAAQPAKASAASAAATPAAGAPNLGNDFNLPTEGSDPQQSAAPNSGMDGLLPAPNLRGSNSPTLFEAYPSGAYQFHTDLGDSPTPGTVTDKGTTSVANILLTLLTWIVRGAITIVQWAFSLHLVHTLTDGLAAPAAALKSAIYDSLLVVVVALSGLWLLGQAGRGRATSATQGLLWALGVLAAGGIFVANPTTPTRAADAVAVHASQITLGAESTITSPAESVTDPATFLEPPAPPSYAGPTADAALRKFGDRYWRTFVGTPWCIGEVGSLDACKTYGTRILSATSLTSEQAKLAPDQRERLSVGLNDRLDSVNEEIKQADPNGAHHWFVGKNAPERVGITLAALLVAILMAVLILVLALAVIVAQLFLLLLVLLAPIYLLVGIHPSGAGRRWATGWAAHVAGALVQRVILAGLLGAVVVVSSLLYGLLPQAGWGMTVTLQLILVVAALIFRSQLIGVAGLATPGAASSAVGAAGLLGARALYRAGRRRLRSTPSGSRPYEGREDAPAGTRARGGQIPPPRMAYGNGGRLPDLPLSSWSPPRRRAVPLPGGAVGPVGIPAPRRARLQLAASDPNGDRTGKHRPVGGVSLGVRAAVVVSTA
ncbi:MAG: type IV secretion system protein, partial [Catenulispora sp.]